MTSNPHPPPQREHIVKAEVIDRVLYDDGWSVQVDLVQFESGKQRYMIYVFPDQEDSYPWSQEANSLHEALQEMGWLFRYWHDDGEGYTSE